MINWVKLAKNKNNSMLKHGWHVLKWKKMNFSLSPTFNKNNFLSSPFKKFILYLDWKQISQDRSFVPAIDIDCCTRANLDRPSCTNFVICEKLQVNLIVIDNFGSNFLSQSVRTCSLYIVYCLKTENEPLI